MAHKLCLSSKAGRFSEISLKKINHWMKKEQYAQCWEASCITTLNNAS